MEEILFEGEIHDAVFTVNENNSGIKLESFNYEENTYKIEKVLCYKQWNFGRITPGAGQVGIYKTDGIFPKYVVIKDYSTCEGDWRVILIYFEEKEQELKEKLMMDPLYGISLMEYCF